MQTEKQRERLVELLKEADANPYNREITNFEDIMEMIADHLIANGVTVEIKQEEMTKNIMDLLKYAKSKNSVAVELQKDEYLYLLEYMEKAENALKERCEELLPPLVDLKGKTITIPRWRYNEHKGETE